MTSDDLFVWIHLPGSAKPVLCGKATCKETPAGAVGEFVYGKSYLGRRDAIEVDPYRLPLADGIFATTLLRGHFSAILDAGPDSWGQSAIDREFGPQTENGYLRLTGDATTGALAFSADHTEPWHADPPVYDTLEDLLEAARRLESNQQVTPAQKRLLRNGTGGGGARPKATIVHKGDLWIAKFPSIKDPENLPSNPRVEHATLLLAKKAGIDTVEHELVRIGDKDVLLVKRFDREPIDGGLWGRSRYVSARTVQYSEEGFARYSYGGSYTRLAQEFRRWVRNPGVDAVQLFRRIAFNCLVSNTDDHDQNLGLISRDGRQFELSPAFDLVAGVHATQVLHSAAVIGDYGSLATRANLLSRVDRYHLDRASGDAIISQVRQVITSEWEACFAKAGIGAADRENYRNSICPRGFDAPAPEAVAFDATAPQSRRTLRQSKQ